MSQTMIPAEQHIHVDLDFDVQHKFHYRSRGRDGHRVVLHRGDAITFTCSDEFSIRFVASSPFEAPVPAEPRSLMVARVRHDAPYGVYEYILEVRKAGQLFTDPPAEAAREFPQLTIEAAI